MGAIDVKDLRRLQRDLRSVDKQIPKDMGKVVRKAATIVRDDARARVPVRSGRARAGIRSGGSAVAPWVKGGVGTRYGAWLDFGSRTPRRGNPRRRGPWKGSGQGPAGGRFLYPAVAAKGDEVAAVVMGAVDDGMKAAGFPPAVRAWRRRFGSKGF